MKTVKASKKQNNLFQQLDYQLMVIPGMIALFIFSYVPMYGVIIAFQRYSSLDTLSTAEWVGVSNFIAAFSDPSFWNATKNTIYISLIRILIGFPIPIILAVMIFELKDGRFKKASQTISYLPHFLSWVILGGMVISWLSGEGFINNILISLGMADKPIPFMIEPKYFYWVSSLSDIWKESGWGTILYLAAMATIDDGLFEASMIDGATRFQKIWHITLPSIRGIIALTFVMTASSLFSSNFDQAMVLQNPLNIGKSEVLSTYVFKMGITQGDFGYATAVGVALSIISLILLYSTNLLTKKLNDTDIF